MKTRVICENCVFAHKDEFGLKCLHPQVELIDYAEGEHMYASEARMEPRLCGPAARYYQAMPFLDEFARDTNDVREAAAELILNSEPIMKSRKWLPSALKQMLWRNLATIVILLVCLLAMAIEAFGDTVVARVDNPHRFASADEAARAALEASVLLSRRYEYGGLVIQCGEVFAYTTPVTNKSEVRVHYRYEYPSACRVVAMYHTHTSDTGWANGRSQADLDAQRALGVVSYIMITRSRRINVYDRA